MSKPPLCSPVAESYISILLPPPDEPDEKIRITITSIAKDIAVNNN